MADVQLHSETKNRSTFGFPATPWGSHIGEAYDLWCIPGLINLHPHLASTCFCLRTESRARKINVFGVGWGRCGLSMFLVVILPCKRCEIASRRSWCYTVPLWGGGEGLGWGLVGWGLVGWAGYSRSFAILHSPDVTSLTCSSTSNTFLVQRYKLAQATTSTFLMLPYQVFHITSSMCLILSRSVFRWNVPTTSKVLDWCYSVVQRLTTFLHYVSSNNFAIATRFFSNTEDRYEALPRTPNTFWMRRRDLETMGKLCPIVLQDTCAYTKNKQKSKIKCQITYQISKVGWSPYHVISNHIISDIHVISNHLTSLIHLLAESNILNCTWSSTGSRPRPHRSPGEKSAAESHGNPRGNPMGGKILIKMGECVENDVKKKYRNQLWHKNGFICKTKMLY